MIIYTIEYLTMYSVYKHSSFRDHTGVVNNRDSIYMYTDTKQTCKWFHNLLCKVFI